jgi:hypothetical protein
MIPYAKRLKIMSKWKIVVITINVVLLWKISMWQLLLGTVPLWDFDVYYRTVRDVLAGSNPYQLPYMQTSGPPIVILFFLPFTWFSLTAARGLLALINTAALLCTSYMLVRRLSPKWVVVNTLALNALFLLSFPVRFNFIVGQPNPLLMLAVTLILTTHSNQQRGLAVALLSFVKSNYLIVLASMLRKYKHSLAIAGVTLGALFVLSVLVFSTETYRFYFADRASSFIFSPAVTTDGDYYNQSLRATMARFQIGHFYPYFYLPLVAMGIIYLLVSEDIPSSILLSLLLSPIIWQHYISVTYPVLFLSGVQVWRNKKYPWWWLVSLALLTLHFPQLHNQPANFVNGILISHYFWGLLILLVLQIRLKQLKTIS